MIGVRLGEPLAGVKADSQLNSLLRKVGNAEVEQAAEYVDRHGGNFNDMSRLVSLRQPLKRTGVEAECHSRSQNLPLQTR